MASAVVTVAAGGNAGATLRQLAKMIEKAASPLGDTNGSGASVTCTITDNPSAGIATAVVAGGGLATQPTYSV